MVLKRLSPSEARRVAERPYDFVAYCADCRRDHPGTSVGSAS